MAAAHYHLDNLIAVVDYNKVMAKGFTHDQMSIEPFADKWRSFGFAVREVDGHDVAALRATLHATPFDANKPSAIICHTIKGKGVSFAENNMKWHHKNKVTDQEAADMLAAIEAA